MNIEKMRHQQARQVRTHGFRFRWADLSGYGPPPPLPFLGVGPGDAVEVGGVLYRRAGDGTWEPPLPRWVT